MNYLSIICECEAELRFFLNGKDDFSRNRKLPLKHFVGSLLHKSLSQSGRGYELIYAHYHSQLEGSDRVAHLSRSSYCEAREKLCWEAFAHLLTRVNLDSQPQHQNELWHGHRVRAIDGTCVQLPRSEEILKLFPIKKSNYGEVYYPSASLFVAADIFTSQTTHAVIGDRYASERENLKEMLLNFNKGDIAVLDRGLEGKKVWKAFEDTGQFFIGRLRARGGGVMKFDQKKKDQVIEIDVGTEAPLKLRIIRGTRFKTGTHLFIATNLLEAKKYDRKSLLEMYKRRQSVEDVFLNLKNNLHVKNIRAKKINGVFQEIYAALCATSIAAGIRYLFEQNLKGKRTSFKAICWRLETRIAILIEPMSEETICQAFEDLWRFTHFKQPNRSYPRWSNQPTNKWVVERQKFKSRMKNRKGAR